MINDLSRRYLQELKTANEEIQGSLAMEETHDGSDHEVFQTLTSEYNIQLGPLKVNVKKSKTVTGRVNSYEKTAQSFSKGHFSGSREAISKEKLDHMRRLQSPDTYTTLPSKRINTYA